MDRNYGMPAELTQVCSRRLCSRRLGGAAPKKCLPLVPDTPTMRQSRHCGVTTVDWFGLRRVAGISGRAAARRATASADVMQDRAGKENSNPAALLIIPLARVTLRTTVLDEHEKPKVMT